MRIYLKANILCHSFDDLTQKRKGKEAKAVTFFKLIRRYNNDFA